jgi:hypothetical protein
MKLALIVGLVGGPGCVATEGDEMATATSAVQQANGREINGTSFYGISFGALEGVVALPDHVPVEAPKAVLKALIGQATWAPLPSGSTFQAASLEAGTLYFKVSDTPVPVSISGTSGYTSYALQAKNDLLDYADICDPNVRVIAIPGRFDDRAGYAYTTKVMTLACENSSAGKCIKLGYTPWDGAPRDTLFQACVRALRADYLGDGVSHTTNGRIIDIFDQYYQSSTCKRINTYDGTPDYWLDEAEWNASGATCVSATRQPVDVSSLPACPILTDVTATAPHIFTRIH